MRRIHLHPRVIKSIPKAPPPKDEKRRPGGKGSPGIIEDAEGNETINKGRRGPVPEDIQNRLRDLLTVADAEAAADELKRIAGVTKDDAGERRSVDPVSDTVRLRAIGMVFDRVMGRPKVLEQVNTERADMGSSDEQRDRLRRFLADSARRGTGGD